MAVWNEPKSNYIVTDEVKPSIFNELAENEKYLKEEQDTKITSAQVKDATIASLVYGSRTNLADNEVLRIGFGKMRKWFGDLRALAFKNVITESDISGSISGAKISGAVALASNATKLATSRSIGLSGVVASSRSFNGTSAITIPITAVPASLLTGTIALDSTKNSATATKLKTARTIAISGVTPQAVSFDGSKNISILISGIPANLISGTANINITGNANTSTKASKATQLETARTIGLSGVSATAKAFNGTSNITIPITSVPTSLLSGNIDSSRINNLAIVSKTGSYNDLKDKPSSGKQVIWSSATPTVSVPLSKTTYQDGAIYEFLCKSDLDYYVFYQKYIGDRFMGLNSNSTGYMNDSQISQYFLTTDIYTSVTHMYGGRIYVEADSWHYSHKNYPCYQINKLT